MTAPKTEYRHRGFQTLGLLVLLAVLNDGIFSVTHFASVIAVTFLLAAMSTFKQNTKYNLLNNPVIILFAITVSFLLPFSNILRWIVFGFFSGILVLKQRQDILGKVNVVAKSFNFVLAGNVLLGVLSKYPKFLLEFLSFGYDNAFHFSIFRDYRVSGSFPFGLSSNWPSDFGLFRTYPSGQAAIWSFFAEPLIGSSTDPSKNLSAYATLSAICLFGITAIIWKLLAKSSGGNLRRNSLSLIFSVLIFAGLVGTLFTNGFIPYAAGLGVLLVLVYIYPSCNSPFARIFSLTASIFLLALTAPSLVIFLGLPSLIYGYSELKTLVSSRKYQTFFNICVVVLLVFTSILWVSHKTTSSFGWRQILAGGGIQPPNFYEILIIFLIFSFSLFKLRKRLVDDLLLLVALSGLLSVGLFATITVAYTGSIQYYAIKQCYVWLVFGATVVCREFLKQNHVKSGRFITTSICLSCVLVLPVVFPRVYTGGFMGTFPNAIAHTLNVKGWKSEVVNANVAWLAISAEKKNDNECLILRYGQYESDLNSRWLNSLTPQDGITNDCFSGFWNSTALTLSELQDRLDKLHGPFVIVIDRTQAKKVPSISSNTVRYLVLN